MHGNKSRICKFSLMDTWDCTSCIHYLLQHRRGSLEEVRFQEEIKRLEAESFKGELRRMRTERLATENFYNMIYNGKPRKFSKRFNSEKDYWFIFPYGNKYQSISFHNKKYH